MEIKKVKEDVKINSFDKFETTFLDFMLEGIKQNKNYNEKNEFIKETYMVEMRDGVCLATDVYKPIILAKPHGCIFLRTPYDKDDLNDLGIALAIIGWPCVIQDMRGMHASEGVYQGYRKCCTDGPDSLEWIGAREWSNGRVATVGPSAFGITQYFTAGANPPELSCQAPMVATPVLQKHAAFQGGEFRKSLVEKWLDSVGATYLLEEIYSNENSSDPTWINVTLEDKWQNVNVPAIHMGGWYDIFLNGTIQGYLGYQKQGGPGAKGNSKLVIGPWWHDGYIEYEQGELRYPENSMQLVELVDMFLEMVNKYTMNKDNDFDNRPNVWYYVMGDVDDIDSPGNEWRYADDWPIDADYVSWYLHENGIMDKSLPESYYPLNFEYDPSNPVPTIGGQNMEIAYGPKDQRVVEDREDVLVFTSENLEQAYEATGPIKARLFVSSNCIDTDFTVKLTDVYPDGRSMLITDGILRMRNRNGLDHWDFINPGQIYEIKVDLLSTSYIWNIGHKIRVSISSSNYPRFLANPNTGDSIYDNISYNIAQNTIYIDSAHPSSIIFPEINQGPISNPPEKPKKPTGVRKIKENKFYIYTSSTTDPDMDDIYLLFDWDDGKSSGWLGPYKSGDKISASHKWEEKGSYQIRVKSKDINGTQSEWSEPLEISMPKSRQVNSFLLYQLINRIHILKSLFEL